MEWGGMRWGGGGIPCLDPASGETGDVLGDAISSFKDAVVEKIVPCGCVVGRCVCVSRILCMCMCMAGSTGGGEKEMRSNTSSSFGSAGTFFLVP